MYIRNELWNEKKGRVEGSEYRRQNWHFNNNEPHCFLENVKYSLDSEQKQQEKEGGGGRGGGGAKASNKAKD